MQKKIHFFFILILINMITSEQAKASYTVVSYPNDPLHTKIYTLANGLTVYLSEFKDKPRIQTYIAVKAGSKFDPKETTGLAHYLEHMMFKGTPSYGTENWVKEKAQLDELSRLFELHKNVTTEEEKKAIYKQIDSVSYEASKFAIPNEYDKMATSIGCKGTNAYTSNDQTVYVNDIPNNEIEKWCMLESERFQHLVLRLFHTELETVYEEFNRSQDNDQRWSLAKVWEGLLPNHPYGTQTTIGVGEHLKNPSMVNIHNYFDTYYRPNNVAICMSGDFHSEEVIKLIDKYFGGWKPGVLPVLSFPEAPVITSPIIKETFGQQPEHLFIGYLFKGEGTRDATYLQMLDMLLSNGKTGLLDVNINQKQKTLEARCSPQILNDYSFLMLYGKPRNGQSMEEVKDLLLAEVEKLKAGEFSQEDMQAVITNLKYQEMKSIETNSSRASHLVDVFVSGEDFQKSLKLIDDLSAITKAQLVQFANEHLKNNYVVSYKRKGDDKERHKVDKPKITPVVINRDSTSVFAKSFNAVEAHNTSPVFLDFKKEIQSGVIHKMVPIEYIPNTLNKTFSLTYILDMGSWNDKDLSIASSYFRYLGTDKYTLEALKNELFRLGLNFDLVCYPRQTRISLSGLEENVVAGIQLVEHVITHIQPDRKIYETMVADILKSRANNKLDKNIILQTMMSDYVRFGEQSPAKYIYSEAELKAMDDAALLNKLKNIFNYKHRIFYFGQKPLNEVVTMLDANHAVAASLKDYPTQLKFEARYIDAPEVYFYNYDMVQAEILLINKDEISNPTLTAANSVLNEYFGSGLSSIIFQEIREQKALAYSAYCIGMSPAYKEDYHFTQAYIGTQADKVKDALPTLQALMNNMPRVQSQFENAKESALKKLETDRTTRSDIFWLKEALANRGITNDYRNEVYANIQKLTLDDIAAYFDQHIKNKKYAIAIIGNKNKLDMDFLKGLGTFKEVNDMEIFGY